MRIALWVVLLVSMFPLVSTNAAVETGSQHEHAGHDDEENRVELTDEQIRMAGISTLRVERSVAPGIVTVPGEIALNAYRTTKVAPRIPAQIVARHARLGDAVVEDQPLVTLSSVEMAQAQGELLVADREWRRVRDLGRKVVSEQRSIEAEVTYQQAYARVRAYGMSETQIATRLRSGNAAQATGAFELLSPQSGTVISDDFIVGEIVDAGRVLFAITDEASLWVEASLTPEQAADVEVGAAAQIIINGRHLEGRVIQAHHALDESTRTLAARISIENPDHRLHPGEFVSVEISSNQQAPAISVPEHAVLRSPDGDWQVFIEEGPGNFEPREVEIIRAVGDRLVVDGLEEGERIVSSGAFFLQSEIAKGGFDVHNH